MVKAPLLGNGSVTSPRTKGVNSETKIDRVRAVALFQWSVTVGDMNRPGTDVAFDAVNSYRLLALPPSWTISRAHVTATDWNLTFYFKIFRPVRQER